MAARPFDLVLLGATGYTGALTAEYLARHAPQDLRWAIAGRSLDKLSDLLARLRQTNPQGPRPECMVADLANPASLERIAGSARVILSTAGPYLLHGEPLVRACAQAGTHYADITGEAEFVDRMWLKYHDTAARTGARIVHGCGFEALVPDLGAYYTVRQLPQGVPIRMEGFVRVEATFSKGTPFHSVVTALSRMKQRRAAHRQRVAAEPRPANRRIGATGERLRFQRELGTWSVPFPSVDPQIVRRSAAALDCYGPDFRYGHYLQVPSFGGLAVLLTGAAGLFAASQLSFTRRWLLSLRPPGDGPTAEERARGSFKMTFLGESDGAKVRTQISGGDPGYGETSKMLAETGLCLALDELPAGRAGSLTPVVAMGDALLHRLQAAGIRFEVLSRAQKMASASPSGRGRAEGAGEGAPAVASGSRNGGDHGGG